MVLIYNLYDIFCKCIFYHFPRFNNACCMFKFSWSTYGWKNLINFLKFESESELGMMYLMCSKTLEWAIWFRRCWFSTLNGGHNPNPHIARHRINWEIRILTTYSIVGKKCQWVIVQMCIDMQSWLHEGEHLHVCNYSFWPTTRSWTSYPNHIGLQFLLSTNN